MPCLSWVNRSFFTSPRESHTPSGTYREQTEPKMSRGGASLVWGMTRLLTDVTVLWALRLNNQG